MPKTKLTIWNFLKIFIYMQNAIYLYLKANLVSLSNQDFIASGRDELL